MKIFNRSLTSEYKSIRLWYPGMSATARKRKEEVAQALKKLIQAKGKMPAMKYQQLLEDLRGQSETVSFLFCFYWTTFWNQYVILASFKIKMHLNKTF